MDRESENFAAVVARIRKASPTVIFNAVNGRGNMYLFRELKAAGLDAATCPVLSFSIAENEVRAWGIDLFVGHYAAWNYFQSVGGPVNARFVGAYKLLRGDTVTNDPIQTAYVQVHLFKQACLRAKRLRVPDILNAIRQRDSPIRFDAPEGLVQVDPVSQHLWRRVRIGEVQQDGQFKIVHESKDWVEPVPRPYPQLSDTVTRPDPMTR